MARPNRGKVFSQLRPASLMSCVAQSFACLVLRCPSSRLSLLPPNADGTPGRKVIEVDFEKMSRRAAVGSRRSATSSIGEISTAPARRCPKVLLRKLFPSRNWRSCEFGSRSCHASECASSPLHDPARGIARIAAVWSKCRDSSLRDLVELRMPVGRQGPRMRVMISSVLSRLL